MHKTILATLICVALETSALHVQHKLAVRSEANVPTTQTAEATAEQMKKLDAEGKLDDLKKLLRSIPEEKNEAKRMELDGEYRGACTKFAADNANKGIPLDNGAVLNYMRKYDVGGASNWLAISVTIAGGLLLLGAVGWYFMSGLGIAVYCLAGFGAVGLGVGLYFLLATGAASAPAAPPAAATTG